MTLGSAGFLRQNAAPSVPASFTSRRELSALTDAMPPAPIREIVGLFREPQPLEACIQDLLKAGFEHADLSVLGSHAAIEAADPEGLSWRERLMPLLTETRYEVPLVAGTLIALTAGPTGALIAGLAAAGVGAAALREMLQEVTSLPDTEEFAAAVEAGEIVLWVVVGDAQKERTARDVLEAHGARTIHVHERTPSEDPSDD